jgi:hypothetical protein
VEAETTPPAGPETPTDSPLTMEQVLASPVYRNLMTAKLEVGDEAFPFELPRLASGTHEQTGETVRLADFAGKRPVALIFGSYT